MRLCVLLNMLPLQASKIQQKEGSYFGPVATEKDWSIQIQRSDTEPAGPPLHKMTVPLVTVVSGRHPLNQDRLLFVRCLNSCVSVLPRCDVERAPPAGLCVYTSRRFPYLSKALSMCLWEPEAKVRKICFMRYLENRMALGWKLQTHAGWEFLGDEIRCSTSRLPCCTDCFQKPPS
jgi:hypothetical protein